MLVFDLFLIALVVIAAIAASRMNQVWRELSASRRAVQPAPEPPPEAVCGCGHHFAFHDLEAGKCRDLVPVTVTTGGRVHSQSERECTCVKYVGPQPEPLVFDPRALA